MSHSAPAGFAIHKSDTRGTSRLALHPHVHVIMMSIISIGGRLPFLAAATRQSILSIQGNRLVEGSLALLRDLADG